MEQSGTSTAGPASRRAPARAAPRNVEPREATPLAPGQTLPPVPAQCLAVVIPCYNEVRTVDELLRRVLAQPCVAEVWVVDDGSTDGTWERLQTWPGRDARVGVFRLERNCGKGAALRTGFAVVTAPVVIVQDADLEYDPADYPRLLAPIVTNQADVVYGSRFRTTAGAANPWWHRVGNRLLTLFSNWLTGLQLTDEATCYKLFRRELLARLDLRENGFGFCPEFTAKVARLGLRVVEVPVRYQGRTQAEGKKIRLWHGLQAGWCVLKYSGVPWRGCRGSSVAPLKPLWSRGRAASVKAGGLARRE